MKWGLVIYAWGFLIGLLAGSLMTSADREKEIGKAHEQGIAIGKTIGAQETQRQLHEGLPDLAQCLLEKGPTK